MGQADVLKFLERNKGKKFTTKQINKKLKFGCAGENLSKLYRDGFIKRSERNVRRDGFKYWI